MGNPTVTHRKVSGQPADPDPTLIDGPAWDDTHLVTGLENVDNTSDASKPVSTAQAAAIAVVQGSADAAQSDITTHKANTSNPHSVTKAQVGLGSVPNTDATNADNVTGGTQTGTGGMVRASSPTLTTPNIVGTGTNNNAAAGSVGEYVPSTVLGASAVSLTTSTPADITSISLTAGDWDVWATIDTNTTGTTDVTQIGGWISTTSQTFPTVPNNGAIVVLNYPAAGHVGFNDHLPVGQMRLSLSGTTTVYLSMRTIFTASTMKGYGFIAARRVR